MMKSVPLLAKPQKWTPVLAAITILHFLSN